MAMASTISQEITKSEPISSTLQFESIGAQLHLASDLQHVQLEALQPHTGLFQVFIQDWESASVESAARTPTSSVIQSLSSNSTGGLGALFEYYLQDQAGAGIATKLATSTFFTPLVFPMGSLLQSLPPLIVQGPSGVRPPNIS